MYAALKKRHNDARWTEWPHAIAFREPVAMAAAKKELHTEILYQKYIQFLFFRQWAAIREAADARGIDILGDVPIYVAADSADVWANRELFQLDDKGEPTVVAGVPPDYFSETGQRWGNPSIDGMYSARKRIDGGSRASARLGDLRISSASITFADSRRTGKSRPRSRPRSTADGCRGRDACCSTPCGPRSATCR
jgi:hypothetical protein